MTWPNNEDWFAGIEDRTVETSGGSFYAWVADCGVLNVPSGQLAVCDPFAAMIPGGNPHVVIPPGSYPVSVTLADVSTEQDRNHVREAYATVRIASGVESYRRVLACDRNDVAQPDFTGDQYSEFFFPVDAGTACFVDNKATEECMPDANTWLKGLFENERPDSWFNMMDDPNHIRAGLANVELPLARQGENIAIIHSGWGDGFYPVVGSFDADDRLLAVHIDFDIPQSGYGDE